MILVWNLYQCANLVVLQFLALCVKLPVNNIIASHSFGLDYHVLKIDLFYFLSSLCVCDCDFHAIQGAAALTAFLVSAVFHEVHGLSLVYFPIYGVPFCFYFCLIV